MEKLWEIFMEWSPVVITGLVTFLLTRYEYGKKIPLDKYEIAYNRIYFPIYYMIMEKKSAAEILEKSDNYFKKYYKYVDRSTLISYRDIKRNLDNIDKSKEYINFENNIIDVNSMLRRRLGYLEPSIINIYKYLPQEKKSILRLLIEVMYIYILCCCYIFAQNSTIRQILTYLCSFAVIVVLVETVNMIFWVLKKLFFNVIGLFRRKKI